jgi:YD repeat-containing protein
VTRPDGSTVTYAYSGAITEVTESVSAGVSHTTTQHWQAFGSPGDARLASVIDPKGSTMTYTYNAPGHLTSVDAESFGGSWRGWTYDTSNHLDHTWQPESGTTSYEYDAAGRVVGTTDARGVAVNVQYDASGRPVLTNAPGTAEDVTTTYDAVNRVHTVANGTVQTTFAYQGDRLSSRTDVIAGQTFTQQFAYDGMDNLVSITYPISGRVAAGASSTTTTTRRGA